MQNIEFSIIIPLYNKAKYVAQTIQSVLNQTWQYFEIIIVNDGSTDNSIEMVKSFNDKRIRIIGQENFGVSVARNNGIKAAKNNWIALLDADDEWEPNYLDEYNRAIRNSPEYIGYATNFTKNNIKNRLRMPKLKFIPKEEGRLDNYFKSCFWGQHGVITSSSICLNKFLLKNNDLLNLFPQGIKRGEDLDAWTRLNLNNDIYFINKPLVRINNYIDSVSNLYYNLDQSFNYNIWLSYKTKSKEKKMYLFLLVLMRQWKILKKLIYFRQFKDIPKLLIRFIKAV